MYKILLFAFTSLLLIGCSPTRPSAIPEKLLKEMTPPQAAELESLERLISTLPDQKIELEKKQTLAEAELAEAKQSLATLKEGSKLLSKAEKAFEKAKDAKALEETKQKIILVEGEIGNQKIRIASSKANLKAITLAISWKEAQMAHGIAKQRLTQAHIAKAFQDSKAPATDEKAKEDKEEIQTKVYEEYFAYQEEELTKALLHLEVAKSAAKSALDAKEALPKKLEAPATVTSIEPIPASKD
ncbi:MAG: hypothetical protein QNL04_05805 [SAR324 cluster bacterium]|nr:hypothetical protein [SAR324 cluster bacterium]